MQILISCAKDMRTDSDLVNKIRKNAHFEKEAESIAEEMAEMDARTLQKLFKCSTEIAEETKFRFERFKSEGTKLPTCLVYDGVAFKHLDAGTLNAEEMDYAETHLWIISFLYGMLRPLDSINRYRMEGNIRLIQNNQQTMFEFWKPRLTDYMLESITEDDGKLCFLSTEEMKRMLDWKRIKDEINVIEPEFLLLDRKSGKSKTLSVHAKMCRGAMSRFIIQNKIDKVEGLTSFRYNGYSYHEDLSTLDKPVFVCVKE